MKEMETSEGERAQGSQPAWNESGFNRIPHSGIPYVKEGTGQLKYKKQKLFKKIWDRIFQRLSKDSAPSMGSSMGGSERAASQASATPGSSLKGDDRLGRDYVADLHPEIPNKVPNPFGHVFEANEGERLPPWMRLVRKIEKSAEKSADYVANIFLGQPKEWHTPKGDIEGLKVSSNPKTLNPKTLNKRYFGVQREEERESLKMEEEGEGAHVHHLPSNLTKHKFSLFPFPTLEPEEAQTAEWDRGLEGCSLDEVLEDLEHWLAPKNQS